MVKKGQFVGRHGDRQQDLEVEPLGGGRYVVMLDGKRHIADARRFAGGMWSVILDDQSYDVELEVAGDSESDGAYNALVRGRVVSLVVEDERHLRMAATSKRIKIEGPQDLSAPMPGKIVKILVQPDQEVTEGQPLLVIEAMKMENEIRSPSAGKVTRILVKEGQNVESNAKLISLG